MVAEGDLGLLPLSCGARKLASAGSLSTTARPAVAARLAATQPARPTVLGAHAPAPRPMGSRSPSHASSSEGTLRRHSSKVEAVCVSRARTDLCGACWVTGIPTATNLLRNSPD